MRHFCDAFSVVNEVSDDKDLPKMERKRLQVVHAPHKSPQAKLVKLADKLYNLRDLHRVLPQYVQKRQFSFYIMLKQSLKIFK